MQEDCALAPLQAKAQRTVPADTREDRPRAKGHRAGGGHFVGRNSM